MTPHQLPPSLSPLVSHRTGVVRRLRRLEKGVLEPRLPILYQATLAHFDFQRVPEADRSGVGRGLSEAQAAIGAVGEAVERYCASQPTAGKIVRTTARDLGDRAVDPRDCILYSETQYMAEGFPYARYNEECEMAWVNGRMMPSGREVMIPAIFAYLESTAEHPGEVICGINSSGLAAGPDLAFASLNGLYELLERDAFLVTWMNRLAVPEIDVSAMPGAVGEIYRHYRRYGVELRVFNVTSDIGISSVVAITVDQTGRGPAVVVGLGCHLDPAVAVQRAVFEVSQVRTGESNRMAHLHVRRAALRPEDVRTIDDHSALFAAPNMLPELEFLLRRRDVISIEDLKGQSLGSVEQDLSRVIAAVAGIGSEIICVDLTTDDIKSVGLRVVRMIATGLQPIHFGFGEERLGGDRLFRAPQQMGFSRAPSSEAELNRCPHPLA